MRLMYKSNFVGGRNDVKRGSEFVIWPGVGKRKKKIKEKQIKFVPSLALGVIHIRKW